MENKFLVKMDLSNMPSDIIYNISKYLVDSPVLDIPKNESLFIVFLFW